jgi:hypothetical protein
MRITVAAQGRVLLGHHHIATPKPLEVFPLTLVRGASGRIYFWFISVRNNPDSLGRLNFLQNWQFKVEPEQ